MRTEVFQAGVPLRPSPKYSKAISSLGGVARLAQSLEIFRWHARDEPHAVLRQGELEAITMHLCSSDFQNKRPAVPGPYAHRGVSI